MDFDLTRFHETFFEESEDHLAAIEHNLLRLEAGESDPEILDTIFRGAHSLKGASGTFGFEDLAHFTHELETLLDQLRSGRPTTREINGLLIRSLDVLRELVAAARSGSGAPDAARAIASELKAASAAPNSSPAAITGPAMPCERSGDIHWKVHFRPSPEIFQRGMDPILVLRELRALGEFVSLIVDSSQLPRLQELDPVQCHLAWDIELVTGAPKEEILDIFAFVEDDADIRVQRVSGFLEQNEGAMPPQQFPERTKASEPPPKSQRETSSIRVATDKVDKMVDLVGELVIAQSMAAQILQDFTPSRLSELRAAFAGAERNTRELQERVMAIRMIPVGTLFSRFGRLVRDLAGFTGKKIVLEVSGDETELDKGVVDSLSDPLMHIIRNSADHGLEMAEERKQRGKTEHGTIRLEAFHRGGNVVVQIRDDGRGLDAGRIREKAVSRGMIAPDAQLSPEEIHQLIFAAGFSTADTITDISGRGVGMDVVKRNIEALNGTVTIESLPGQGTCVRIELPLTLAIVDGLLVRVGDQTYVLPLTSIVESIRPQSGQLNSMAGHAETVVVRGEPLPLLRLHQLFAVRDAITDPVKGIVVLIETQGRNLALLVDELLGQQQVVVKSLETNFRRLEGVIGATILGDGRAALIIDVTGLMNLKRNLPSAA
jgi:two-component system chemotaxis sensor kinase CheA